MKRRLGIGFLVVLVVGFAVAYFARGGSAEVGVEATKITTSAFVTRAETTRLTVGRVIDRAGAPIASAIVLLGDARPMIAITARDGSWATALADGTYTVSVSAAGFLPSTRRVSLDDARETILDRGGITLHGVVEDVSGGPIGGARIRFADDDDALIAIALVDDAGRYSASLPAAELVATAEAEGYTTVKRGFDLRGASIPPGNFRLSVGGAIRGTVVGPDGSRCREAVVFAEVGTGYHTQKLEATATATGEFEVVGLQPGDVALQASGPGCATRDPKMVALAVGGEVENVTLTAERAFTLTGRVVDRGTREPVANVKLHLDRDQLWTIRGGATSSDATGAYAIHGILPGSYELDVNPTKHLVDLIGLEIAADTRRDVELERGRTISGRVDPPAVATLELELSEYHATELASRRKQAIGVTTNTDGTFAIENAVDGALELGARSADGASFGKVTLAEQGDQRDVVIAMKPFGDGTVVGSVAEESGAPVAGVEVGVWWPNDRFGETRKVVTAADGSFRFEHLPRRELGFVVEGRAPVDDTKLQITPGDRSELRIVVRDQGASIRGRVVDASGKPAPDVAITGMPPMDGPGSYQIPRTITDATGAFTLEGLRPGDYKIQATTPSGDGQTFVTAHTGETVTITLARTGRLEFSVVNAGKPVAEFQLSCRFEAPVASLDMPTIGSFSTGSRRTDGIYRSDDSYPLGRATCHITADAGGAVATIEIGKRAEISLSPWAVVRGTVPLAKGRAVYVHGDTKPSNNPDDDLGRQAFRGYEEIEGGKLVIDHAFPGVGWIAIYAHDFSKLFATRRIDVTSGQQLELGTIALDK